MTSRELSRFALGIGATAALLAACGGSQPPIGATGALPQSHASSGYDTLYSFGKRSSDGQQPKAGLIDVNGTLYGTTFAGGRTSCVDGCGTVFKIKSSGKETVAYRFTGGPDGANPSASLLVVKGVLYGTTEYGGGEANLGSVFKLNANGIEKVLYGFRGYYYHEQHYNDGANPVASLIYVNGKFYGTTYSGGASQYYGTVFRINAQGKEKVLHSFGFFYPDGGLPAANLLDVNGALYGTTEVGDQITSNGYGTVFSISTAGSEHVLHSFNSSGAFPAAALINVGGLLYGTTPSYGSNNGGTVFSITTSGYLTTLHNFGSGSDGISPLASLLYAQGTLYGTTSEGGAYGKGTVFEMALGGSEKVLHSFGDGSDGATPVAGLIDVNGTLYGTTSAGGTYGDGTVFALKP